jgi:uncharacterized FlaG/YvyC family protein
VKEKKMHASHVQSISWDQHFREYAPVKRETPEEEQERSFPISSSKGPGKSLISYKIDSANGAIKAEIIDSKSGKVVREIEVKPDISMIFSKGFFIDSVI